jgi:hypothetical protein
MSFLSRDIFQKIILQEFSERGLCRNGFISTYEINKLKTKIKNMIKDYYEM